MRALCCLTLLTLQVALEKLKLEQVSWKDFYLSSLLLFGSIHPRTFLLTPGRDWRDRERLEEEERCCPASENSSWGGIEREIDRCVV